MWDGGGIVGMVTAVLPYHIHNPIKGQDSMVTNQIPQELFHEEGYKTVNGIPHFYRIIGQGEPFLFLHGGPGMWHDELVPFFLNFAKSYQAIFYDQRGNGNSLMEEIDETTFTTELLVEDLEALRQEFGLEQLNIIGHSWGGLLGMYYTSKYPQHVKRLILIDAAPVNTNLLIQAYENLMGRFTEEEWAYLQELYESEAYLAGNPDAHNEAMQRSEGAVFFNQDAREEYFQASIFDETKAKNAVAISGPARKMKLTIYVQDHLSNIVCPTLIVQGREDFITPEAAKLAQRLIHGSQLLFIEESGHYPFIEAKNGFFNGLYSFIEETQ